MSDRDPPWPVEVISAFVSILSRSLNALIFRGSMHQTLSARTYVEARIKRGSWVTRYRIINAIFFWQADHCEQAWREEIRRARRTIEVNTILRNQNNA